MTSTIKRSDLRMNLRAVREGWSVTDQQRTQMHADALVVTLVGTERERKTARLLLDAIDNHAKAA